MVQLLLLLAMRPHLPLERHRPSPVPRRRHKGLWTRPLTRNTGMIVSIFRLLFSFSDGTYNIGLNMGMT